MRPWAGVGNPLGHVRAQLGPDRLIVPAAGADGVLDGLARSAGPSCNRLVGLALQAAEPAPQDDPGQLALLDPNRGR